MNSNISLDLVSNSTIICNGQISCRQISLINITTVHCHGLESCYSSHITNVERLYMLGRRSGVNMNIISSTNNDNVEFYFYGEKSGLKILYATFIPVISQHIKIIIQI